MTERWQYKSDAVFAGGGKRHPKASVLGAVAVLSDGRLSIEPEDDYYSGELTAEESLELARLVIARVGKSSLAQKLACPRCGDVHFDACAEKP